MWRIVAFPSRRSLKRKWRPLQGRHCWSRDKSAPFHDAVHADEKILLTSRAETE
jgi:hypothetical protein